MVDFAERRLGTKDLLSLSKRTTASKKCGGVNLSSPPPHRYTLCYFILSPGPLISLLLLYHVDFILISVFTIFHFSQVSQQALSYFLLGGYRLCLGKQDLSTKGQASAKSPGPEHEYEEMSAAGLYESMRMAEVTMTAER